MAKGWFGAIGIILIFLSLIKDEYMSKLGNIIGSIFFITIGLLFLGLEVILWN